MLSLLEIISDVPRRLQHEAKAVCVQSAERNCIEMRWSDFLILGLSSKSEKTFLCTNFG